MDPVGYRRINKNTGEVIEAENIIKGIEYEKGRYVVLTDEEIRAAYPKATQTIAIDRFVPNTRIPFVAFVGLGHKMAALGALPAVDRL